jgi:hypothetical protein
MSKIESARDGAKKAARLARSLEPRVQVLVTDYGRITHCLAALDVLTNAIGSLERAANSEIEPLLSALTRLSGAEIPDVGRFLYAPLGEVLPKLEESASQSDEALAGALQRCIASVTLTGVAAMFGTVPDPPSIATAVIESRYPWASPMWGGASTFAEPRRRVVVFPPMRDDDFEAVRRELEHRGFRPLLLRAASAAAGCAVVAMDFYAIEEYADILPAFYESQPRLAMGEVDAAHPISPVN